MPTPDILSIDDPDLKEAADTAIGTISSVAVRNGCYFDIAVTGKVEHFAAIAEAAVEEERTIVTVVRNDLPVLVERAVSIDLSLDEAASFSINAPNPDGDALTLFLDRNDGGVFSQSYCGDGQGELHFTAINVAGRYFGWVAVGVVQYSASINVIDEHSCLSRIIFALLGFGPFCDRS